MSPSSGEGERGVLINHFFDFLIDNVRNNQKTLAGYRVVPIPDLVKKMEANLLLTTLTASLTATKGTLSDLTSISRAGDVFLSTDGKVVSLQAQISIDLLEIIFNHYTLQASLLKKSGDKLVLGVKKNCFDVLVTLRLNGLECDITLEKISVQEFSSVDVDLKGFSILNAIGGKIASWIVEFFDGFVKELIESYALNMVNYAVSDKDLLQRLLGYAIAGMAEGAASNKDVEPEPLPVIDVSRSRTVSVALNLPFGNQQTTPVRRSSSPFLHRSNRSSQQEYRPQQKGLFLETRAPHTATVGSQTSPSFTRANSSSQTSPELPRANHSTNQPTAMLRNNLNVIPAKPNALANGVVLGPRPPIRTHQNNYNGFKSPLASQLPR